jgi:hypothetical protein
MPSLLILASLVLILVGGLFDPFLLALGIVLLIAALAALGGAPRSFLFLFGTWLLAVLSMLLFDWMSPGVLWDQQMLVLGLPGSTFLMLFGIWVVPILILPLGFLLTFQWWLRK